MADLQNFVAVNIAELEWKEWSHGKRYGGKTKAIADAAGAQKIGVVLEELLPGQQSSPPHYHIKEEEHIWIIRGEVTLRLGGKTYLLQAGHYICFLAGVNEPHCLINESDASCLYLVVGDKIKEDVIVYPESNKISVRLLGQVYMKNRWITGKVIINEVLALIIWEIPAQPFAASNYRHAFRRKRKLRSCHRSQRRLQPAPSG